jgi:hypothetical protein
VLCGDVAASLGMACVLCAVLQHNFSQVQYKLPDDGRRPKHVAAIFLCILCICVYFNVNFIPFQV